MLFEKSRQEFLDLLKSCRHGLSTRDLLPALSCFCFYKGEVISFDNVVSVVAPCDVGGFSGGFRGGVLMKWLETSNAKTIKLCDDKDENGKVEWKAGRSKLRMEMLPAEEFAFSIPRLEGDAVEIPDFREYLQAAAASMGTDPSGPWRKGVTLEFLPDGLRLFSTDNLSVTSVFAEYDVPDALHGTQTILVPRLVDVLLADKDQPTHLAIIKNKTIRFDYESGRKVFCQLSADVDCRKFNYILNMVDWDKGRWCEIPERLSRILEHMEEPLKNVEDALCSFEVAENGVLLLNAKGGGSEMSDWATLKTEKGKFHPPVCVRLNPKVLKRSIEFCDEMIITDKWIAARVEDQVQVVISVFAD